MDRKLTYNLGATGLRGWIYTKPANYLDSRAGPHHGWPAGRSWSPMSGRSPADGVMQVDDVILGVDGKPFSDDARKSIAWRSRKPKRKPTEGVLKLIGLAGGQDRGSAAQAAVMGTYSDTAPWNCPKSKRIFEEACKVLEKEAAERQLERGDQRSRPAGHGQSRLPAESAGVRPQAGRADADPDKKPEGPAGAMPGTWAIGIFLCEYFLLTGDKEVLHAINEYTLSLAKGQSMYGTFGHGFAALTTDGQTASAPSRPTAR